MLINEKSAELIGIYQGVAPANVVGTYYQDKFKRDYSTRASSIAFDSLIDNLRSMDVIPRNTKTPVLTIDGFKRHTFTPDVIGGSLTLTPDELFSIQPGQSKIIFKGQAIDKSVQITERKVSTLKLAYLNTREQLASEIYLTGKITLPNSGSVIDFDVEENTPKELNVDSWQDFILGLVEDYTKKNGILPTRIEVGNKIFSALMKDESFAKLITSYNQAVVQSKDTGYKNIYPSYTILGYRLDVLPPTQLYKKDIDVSSLVIVSNDLEFINTYAGVEIITDSNDIAVEEIDVYISEKVEHDPVGKKYTLKSAYTPIIPIASRVQRYNVTLTNKKPR